MTRGRHDDKGGVIGAWDSALVPWLSSGSPPPASRPRARRQRERERPPQAPRARRSPSSLYSRTAADHGRLCRMVRVRWVLGGLCLEGAQLTVAAPALFRSPLERDYQAERESTALQRQASSIHPLLEAESGADAEKQSTGAAQAAGAGDSAPAPLSGGPAASAPDDPLSIMMAGAQDLDPLTLLAQQADAVRVGGRCHDWALSTALTRNPRSPRFPQSHRVRMAAPRPGKQPTPRIAQARPCSTCGSGRRRSSWTASRSLARSNWPQCALPRMLHAAGWSTDARAAWDPRSRACCRRAGRRPVRGVVPARLLPHAALPPPMRPFLTRGRGAVAEAPRAVKLDRTKMRLVELEEAEEEEDASELSQKEVRPSSPYFPPHLPPSRPPSLTCAALGTVLTPVHGQHQPPARRDRLRLAPQRARHRAQAHHPVRQDAPRHPRACLLPLRLRPRDRHFGLVWRPRLRPPVRKGRRGRGAGPVGRLQAGNPALATCAAGRGPGARIRLTPCAAPHAPLAGTLSGKEIPEEARETARNWFYKVACIRELVPRVCVLPPLARTPGASGLVIDPPAAAVSGPCDDAQLH